jgi:hypothetical protein
MPAILSVSLARRGGASLRGYYLPSSRAMMVCLIMAAAALIFGGAVWVGGCAGFWSGPNGHPQGRFVVEGLWL